MFTRQLAALFALFPIALFWALPSSAMTLDCGPTLCFQYDESQAAVATLGVPVRVGDSMRFLPPAFLVQATGQGSSAHVEGTFVFDRVFTVNGGDVLDLQWRQEGDFEIVGGGSFLASLHLAAESNTGTGQADVTESFTASGPSGEVALWGITAALAPAALFAGSAADLKLTVGFLLDASASSAGEYVFAQSKFVLSQATAVPAPGAFALFIAALGACVLRVRRRAPAN